MRSCGWQVFGAANLTISSAVETTLTGNRRISEWKSMKHRWRSHPANWKVRAHLDELAKVSPEEGSGGGFPRIIIRPMEVRTFLATFE